MIPQHILSSINEMEDKKDIEGLNAHLSLVKYNTQKFALLVDETFKKEGRESKHAKEVVESFNNLCDEMLYINKSIKFLSSNN